jgi:hypothetical protein
MAVVAHQAPGQDGPAIQATYRPQALDEIHRFGVAIKDELAAGDAAVDVVNRLGKEKARMSRHRNLLCADGTNSLYLLNLTNQQM